MKFRLIISILAIALVACKDSQTSNSKNTTNTNTDVSTAQPIYPMIPEALLRDVWDNGEMIDYIFHELPFSMNQTEQNSIRTNLTYVAASEVSSIPQGCKPIGRQFFQVRGDIILESDIYFDIEKGCAFYVFFVDGKAQYANQMAEVGQNFFITMVKKAMEARQNAAG